MVVELIVTFLSIVIILILIFFVVFIGVGWYCHVADWGNFWVNCVDGWCRLFCLHFHRLESNVCRLPINGHAILAANHVSGLDPFLLIAASRRPLRFLIALEEYERFGVKWLFSAAGCIPVDRENRPHLAFKSAIRLLNQGEVIALFPHGKIHLPKDGFRPIKRGVARLSRLSQCPVIAAKIEGVRGEGLVAKALLLRSYAKVSTLPPIEPYYIDDDQLIAKITQFID